MPNNSNDEASASPMDEVAVARQAIYNTQLETIGYELLFRNSGSHSVTIKDGIEATQTLINTSFLELGIEQIVGSSLAFINLPHNFKELVPNLPASLEQSVLEYPLTTEPTQDLINELLTLIDNGHKIALDQFNYTPEILPLLKRVQYIKVDVQSTNKDSLKKIVELSHHTKTKAIAFKIENYDEFEYCKEIGFDAFQGFFFNRPNLVKKEVTRSNSAVLLKLIERINDPKSTIEDIEQLIAQDVSLSYKLLRYINCATFALRREISSIRDAITYIGLLQI
ncbi:MAG: HDOD domain-containing protein, partial [Chromatiales bacterium]|nr:HDOD domain-containing protein [Chromatiales bacterium]